MKKRFKEKVYNVVRRIPRGKVMTYKEIAVKAGCPGAWRAVGNVLNKNNDLSIPCHRVIKSNGQLGGYKRGSEVKKSLLMKEGFLKE